MTETNTVKFQQIARFVEDFRLRLDIQRKREEAWRQKRDARFCRRFGVSVEERHNGVPSVRGVRFYFGAK